RAPGPHPTVEHLTAHSHGSAFSARRLGVYAFCALTLAAAQGSAQAVSQSVTREPAPQPPGTLVDVGGWKLRLNCTGAGSSDAPTIVFESGAGGTSFGGILVRNCQVQFPKERRLSS